MLLHHAQSRRVVGDVLLLAADLHGVQRWLRHVEAAVLHQRRHLPVEERDQQRADVAAVDVGVGQDDHAPVAHLRDVEVGTDAAADGRGERLDLRVGDDLVHRRALDVQDLAAQRQDRLGLRIAGVARGAAGRVALDEEELGAITVARRAVGELVGHTDTVERSLAPGEITRRLGRGARPGRVRGLGDDRLRRIGVLLEPAREVLRRRPIDQ